VSSPNNNSLSFSIFTTWYIKHLLVLDIDEVFTLVLENLPPIGVSAVDLHILVTSIWLDVPWLVVVSGSDSQGLLMEVPSLRFSSVSSLNGEVSIVDEVKESAWS
jgi:hypothetical protein